MVRGWLKWDLQASDGLCVEAISAYFTPLFKPVIARVKDGKSTQKFELNGATMITLGEYLV